LNLKSIQIQVNSSQSSFFLPPPSGWPTRRGASARARARVEPGPGAGIPLLPPRRAPLHRSWRGGSRATSAARPVQARIDWGFRPDVRGTELQRQGKAATRAPKPPTPIGVFPFFTSEHAVRGREKARRRCVEPRRNPAHRSAADTPRPESATAVTRRGEEAICTWGGAGPGAGTSTPS
jgi:hypothetical protein